MPQQTQRVSYTHNPPMEVETLKNTSDPQKSSKVAFARRAVTAQRVAEADTTIPTLSLTPHGSHGKPPTAISLPKGQAGRPRKGPQCNLPPGYRTLRQGISTYTDETADKFVDAYYSNVGSLTRACRDTGVQYSAALNWRQTIPHFSQALNEVDEILKDEAHSQFMERVLTTWESNPTWKLTYFKKHFPQYTETKKSAKFVFNITDTLIKPDIIEAEVIPPKQLESSNEPGPKPNLEASSHSGKVPENNS